MMNQVILEIKKSVKRQTLSDDIEEAIDLGHLQWPESLMTCTKSYGTKRLILTMTSLSKDELSAWLAGVFPSKKKKQNVDLNVTWKILAFEGYVVNQTPLIKYMEDEPIIDEFGTITYVPVTDVTGKLQTYAGHKWTYD